MLVVPPLLFVAITLGVEPTPPLGSSDSSVVGGGAESTLIEGEGDP